MKKIILIIIFGIIILFSTIIFLNCNKNNFEARIEIKFDNISAQEINNNFAEKIKDELLSIQEIKKIVIFSKDNVCHIYCKINPLVFNKKYITDKIERKLNFISNKTINNIEIYFDDDYNKKYQTFLIAYTDKLNDEDFNDLCEKISDNLLTLKISSKILRMGEIKKAIYINFDDSTLLDYNISLNDIKKIIQINNIIENTTEKNNQKTIFPTNIRANIKNIYDIESLLIPYKNKSYSNKLGEIFNIEEKTKTPPEYYINYGNQKAQIFAISNKKFYPNFILEMKLKAYMNNFTDNFENINLDLIRTSKTNKIEIYLNQNSSIFDTYNLYKTISKLLQKEEIIYFIGYDIPKISNKEIYFENEKNKLILLVRKNKIHKIQKILSDNNIEFFNKNSKKITIKSDNLKKLEKKVEKINEILNTNNSISSYINLYSSKILNITYRIDDYSLIDAAIDKQDVINTIFASNDGLICDYFFENAKKIPIILKNKNKINRIFVLNKKFKILTPLNSVAKSTVEEKYYSITRENNEFLSTVQILFKTKNPIRKKLLIEKLKNI